MFGFNEGYKLFNSDEATESTNIKDPASKFFVKYIIKDWSKEPFIQGGYTHPALSSSQKVREDLAEPINNKVFWAGEATHPKAYMTMHGAIETGDFAAKQVLKVLNKNKVVLSKL